METENYTEIQKFYDGKVIFMTGVTGFVGKVLLEKLLRSCPGIKDIYVLMREKRKKTMEERFEDIIRLDLFNSIRSKMPELRKKVKIIYGDLEHPGLGIKPEDVEILNNNVQIVFHSAARVSWDDPIRVATLNHTVAMKKIIKLLKGFKNLKAFVHVSTVFVHREPDLTVPEHVFKKEMSPAQLLNAMEWMDEEMLGAVEKVLLQGLTNTYLLTKALAENIVEDEHGDIPTAIVRPSFVTPTYKEPFAGWCDTLQGIQGLMLAGAKGFLRTLYVIPNLRVNIVPADILVNTCITAAWHINTFRPDNDLLVINCVIDFDKLPFADENLLAVALEKRTKYPLVNMYRYPDFSLYSSNLMYNIHAFFDHYIPAVIGDTLLFIFTGKTIMLRMYKKINFLFGVFIRLGKIPWICKNENLHMVEKSQTEEDSKLFNMNSDDLDWRDYVDDVLLAGRKQLAKEDPSNIPYAKKKAKVWLVVTTFLKWMLLLLFFYLIYSKIQNYNIQFIPVESNTL